MKRGPRRLMLSSSQFDTLRNILQNRLDAINHELDQNDHFDIGKSLRDSVSELSAVDNHPGDLGTEQYERLEAVPAYD